MSTITYFSKFENGAEELWVSDGTVAGTHVVKAIGRSFFSPLTTIDARAFFAADDGVHGEELWVSDGTAAGTMLIDVDPGALPSFPSDLTEIGGTLFFTAEDLTHGFEVWKTDGTAAGTMVVKDIAPGGFSSNPGSLTESVGGTLFFAANDLVHGAELWKSDGTANGTVMVKDIAPGATASAPQQLTSSAGTLFFVADDGVHGAELWTSDGTAAGTVMVDDIAPGRDSSLLQNLTDVNGILFFAADAGDGVQLWKSNGTTAGTVEVKVFVPNSFTSGPVNLTNVAGTLFFTADDLVHGRELWKSDGTAAGTVMVKDINPGANTSAPENLTRVNGTLFFTANDDVHGVELWKSDGTAAGTVMVADLNPGAGGSNPSSLIDAEGVLEFYANDGTTEALFRSDGTAAGTFELARGVDPNTPIGVGVPVINIPLPRVNLLAPNDLDGDHFSNVVWRGATGPLADWSLNAGTISSAAFVTIGGSVVTPAASWSLAGTSDFDGDGKADLLWRNSDGTLADWTMNGSVIKSSDVLSSGGTAVRPDASWSIAGVGDFDGDSRSDVLWRNASGEVAEWLMNGATIIGSGDITAGGVAVRPDASWKVAGIGDFDGDGMADILWRNSSGEVSAWLMNGTSIASSGDLAAGGVAVRPDASWSVAGIGDFSADGDADLLWRNSNGSLAIWQMNGTTITSSASITFNGNAVTPDASWHVVEIGDFDGDGKSDILWRNDSGALSEWLMNGSTISQTVTPAAGGTSVSPDASWTTQAKPTVFA